MLSPVSRLLMIGASLMAVTSAGPAWTYKENANGDALGPAEWEQGYPSCGGSHQSPINIPASQLSRKDWGMQQAPLNYTGNCENYTLRKLDDLFKWEITPDDDCTAQSINNNGRQYRLAQFHVHSTSEHTLDDHHYDAEVHFVHKDQSGNILVTGVLLHAQDGVGENSFIKNMWTDMVSENPSFNLQDSGMTYADLLNGLVAKSHLFNYSGSLTTPPCSEVVDWWVLNNPIPISMDELNQLKKAYSQLEATNGASDNRPTQPINDREIKYY